MRCRKCNNVYRPTGKNRSCPQCGHELPSDKAQRLAQASVRRVKIENRIAVAFMIVCPIIGIAALVTGQLLILGGLLAVICGLYLTLFGIFGYFGNLPNGWLARSLCICFGLPILAGGISCWIWALNGGPVPPFPPSYLQTRREPLDINDFSFLVPYVVLATAGAVAGLINKGLARLEAKRRRKSQEIGEVFGIPSMASTLCIVVLLLLVPISLVLMLASLNEARTGVNLRLGFGLPLVLSPLMVFSYHMLRHNSGHVVLTEDGVLLRRLGRERRMRYEDILVVKDFAFALPPDLVLRGRGKRLRIPRSAENFPRLYQIIRQRREALRPIEAPCFPYRLAVAKGAWVFAMSVILVSMALYLGIGLLPAWDALSKGHGLPLAPEVARSTTILFSIMSAVFIPAMALFIVGSFKLKQPSALVFTEDEIRFRFPFQGWRAREAGELKSVYLDPVHRTVSARHEGVAVSVETTHYTVVLRFEDGLELWIDLDRALQFGSSPERMHGILSQLYRLDA
jgi:hypothetical protein